MQYILDSKKENIKKSPPKNKQEYLKHIQDQANVHYFIINQINDYTFEVLDYFRNKFIVNYLEFNNSCDCHDYIFNDLDCCVHTLAVHRLEKEINQSFYNIPGIPYLFKKENSLYIRNFKKLEDKDYGFNYIDKRIGKIEITDYVVFENSGILIPSFFKNLINQTPIFPSVEVNFDLVKMKLFDFQKTGVKHLVEKKRAALADDMGLGKTIQAITACEQILINNPNYKVLIVSPASVKFQWKKEINNNTNTSCKILNKSKEIKDLETYTIINYELLHRNIDYFIKEKFDVIILDEAQRIKNFETKTWKSIKKLNSEYLFFLSGTLIENSIDDIFNIFEILNKDILGPRWKFEETYKNYQGKRYRGIKNIKELREKLFPYILRRKKKEVLNQLPDYLENKIYVPLSSLQNSLEIQYREQAVEMMAKASSRELEFWEKQIIQACLLKARQACNASVLCQAHDPNDPKPPEDSNKIKELIDILKEMKDVKVIVFSEWIKMLNLAETKLKEEGLEYVLFTGDVPVHKRGELISEFLDGPKNIFLSTDAGGIGLNLQKASTVIHLDLPWNPARLDQRNSRVHRMNQQNKVNIYYLISETGIERGIEGLIDSKRNIRESTLSDDYKGNDDVGIETFISVLSKLKK